MNTVVEYLLENKILSESEFKDFFSVRALKLNQIMVCDPQEKISKGEIITIGFNDIVVK